MTPLLISFCIAYLLGSISTGVLYAKLTGTPDPRLSGSKSSGATNLLRQQGKKAGAIVLFGDMLKGIIAILLASYLNLPTDWLPAVGFFAFLGHLYPVFFKFKGGKGAATGMGVLFVVFGYWSLVVIGIWLFVVWRNKYSSLGALFASGCAFLMAPWVLGWIPSLPILLMCTLLAYKHQANLKRLMAGTEPKIS